MIGIRWQHSAAVSSDKTLLPVCYVYQKLLYHVTNKLASRRWANIKCFILFSKQRSMSWAHRGYVAVGDGGGEVRISSLQSPLAITPGDRHERPFDMCGSVCYPRQILCMWAGRTCHILPTNNLMHSRNGRGHRQHHPHIPHIRPYTGVAWDPVEPWRTGGASLCLPWVILNHMLWWGRSQAAPFAPQASPNSMLCRGSWWGSL